MKKFTKLEMLKLAKKINTDASRDIVINRLIDQTKPASEPTKEKLPEWIRVKQVEYYFGIKSEKLKQLTRDKLIESEKVDGCRLYNYKSIAAYIESCKDGE